MPMHQFFGRGDIPALSEAFQGPLVAFVVAMLLALAAWRCRSASLAVLAGGAGVAAGWFVALHPAVTLTPHSVTDRLALLSVWTTVVALSAQRFAARRGPWPPLLVAAVAVGWWLAGVPHTSPAVAGAWPVWLASAVAIVLLRRLSSARGGTEPLPAILAACCLAAALHLIGAPRIWALLALMPAIAVLPLWRVARLSALALLPPVVDLAGTQIAVALSLGRLAHGRAAPADIAALSPLLALWLYPQIAQRLRRAGRLAPPLAALLGGALALVPVWAALRLLPR
jgi:hypothetical protein